MSEANTKQNSPHVLEVEPGTYAWCACGRSQSQPYCDGSHRGSEFRPAVVEIEEPKEVAWCGCKESGNKPYCDGTHNSL